MKKIFNFSKLSDFKLLNTFFYLLFFSAVLHLAIFCIYFLTDFDLQHFNFFDVFDLKFVAPWLKQTMLGHGVSLLIWSVFVSAIYLLLPF